MEISTKDLEVFLEGTRIIKGMSVEIKEKEFVGILGPNGSGKSTLLKCIYRVLHPKSGEVQLNGKAIQAYSVKESAREMAVVAQHNYYNFDFSVQDVVLMGRSPHKKAMERDNANDFGIVLESLEKVGMKEFRDRSFSTLSGGEQQRVILARALAQKTNCLVLDEPTNHLDIKYQLQLMDIVRSLNLTVVSAIHDLNIAAMYCDKIFVVKDGKIVALGTPEEVLTKEFIKEVYEVDVELLKDQDGLLHILYRPGFK
ncbi:ABC transporter ATP-binding protein [Robinsoniella peoriensis]|uniref:Hemin import ATP-binding protein HmuV n=1 Tax=Robinsoniella peoriensis TaxID=180332 RepID=A0A4U8QBS7_9FIRM|nr:ABC transporter ATP-binding protein [Robinsoniella peoriensis]MDU7031083.1 ABC transporter ATP-binding protein [Clostridiales bacterium]TLD02532.1 Hemin import ATP-binding protein HmuV [Robinsoniella peoriensis]